jgi:hypothetical protein
LRRRPTERQAASPIEGSIPRPRSARNSQSSLRVRPTPRRRQISSVLASPAGVVTAVPESKIVEIVCQPRSLRINATRAEASRTTWRRFTQSRLLLRGPQPCAQIRLGRGELDSQVDDDVGHLGLLRRWDSSATASPSVFMGTEDQICSSICFRVSTRKLPFAYALATSSSPGPNPHSRCNPTGSTVRPFSLTVTR